MPIDSRNPPSRKTWVGDMRVSSVTSARRYVGLSGSRSLQNSMLFSMRPAPGTMTPEPNTLPRVWVTVTAVPSPSATAKCVVCSFAKSAGWPGRISPASRSRLNRSPPETPARAGSMSRRRSAA